MVNNGKATVVHPSKIFNPGVEGSNPSKLQ